MEEKKFPLLELILILIIFALVSLGGSVSGNNAAEQVQQEIQALQQQEAAR